MTEEHESLLRAAYGDRALRIEPLGGGVHGRCYRVAGNGFDHAVRLPAPDASAFRLTPQAEQRVLAAAAAAGIAPAAVPLDPALGWVASEFRAEATAWTPEDAGRPENIDRIADRLRALHACAIDLPAYAPTAAAQRYAAAARGLRELDAEQRAWSTELVERARAFEACFPPGCPAHNDLVASNVLDDGELWLVDFEYAAASAPVLDLAGLAGLNGFDTGQVDRLVSAYYATAVVPFARAELDATIRLVQLMAYFWSLSVGGREAGDAGIGAFADAMAAVLR